MRLLPQPPGRQKPALLLPAPESTALAVLTPSQVAHRVEYRRGAPLWVVALLSTALVLLSCVMVLQRSSAASETKVNTESAAVEPVAYKPSPMQTSSSTSSSTASSTPSTIASSDQPAYPLAQFVEVTGLRVVVDLNHRSQVQYVVVNHSPTPLSGIGLRVAVRSAVAAPGSDVLFTVSARVPTLGPNESKEIRTDLDAQLRSTVIPDWGNLRADVHVTSQQ